MATGLGERVARTRMVASAGAVLLCAAATAIAGPIAFVGLVIPHLCRLLVGTDHRWLLPYCALAGASLLLLADVVDRVIAPPTERSEEHTSELQSLLRTSYAVFCLKQKNNNLTH